MSTHSPAKHPTPAQLEYWQSLRALTPIQETEIRELYTTQYPKPTYAALARKYNVSVHLIFRTINKHPSVRT